MGLQPTGSEIPRSLTQITTTVDQALNGKADFTRLTANPSTTTAGSSYSIDGYLLYDGNQSTTPATLDFVSTNSWSDGIGGTLGVESNKWRLTLGGGGSWLSVQTIATRPENCTWAPEDLVSGTPTVSFTRATVATTGQFALVDDDVYPAVMWENLGPDVAQDWVALTTATALTNGLAGKQATLVSGTNIKTVNSTSLLGSGNIAISSYSLPTQTGNSGKYLTTNGTAESWGTVDLSSYATTSAVAAGYQPLDSDLTAIAALTTTSTGRELLTESTAQTGTGALVRAASPTLTGTLNAAAITASGTVTANSSNGVVFSNGAYLRPWTTRGLELGGTAANEIATSGQFRANGGFNCSTSGTGMSLLSTGIAAGGSKSINVGANSAVVAWTARSGDSTVGCFMAQSDNVLAKTLIARAVASQSVSVFETQNASGTAIVTISPAGNIATPGTLQVGGGTIVTNILSATATLDFPSISSNDTHTLTITVTGAVAGDSVFLGCPAGLDAGLIFCASVTAADTVTVRMHNSSGGSVDPASGTFRATVIRF